MAGKKHMGRFTVQFNLGDPQQARVADILENQGRQKARFISAAVLHYINCKETPEISLPQMPSEAEIERIVLAVLQRNSAGDAALPTTSPYTQDDKVNPPQEAPKPEAATPPDDLKSLLGDDGFSAIANTLAAFHQK